MIRHNEFLDAGGIILVAKAPEYQAVTPARAGV